MDAKEQTQIKIMSSLFEQTKAVQAEGPWGFLSSEESVRVLSCSLTELEASLSEKFSESSLTATGVLVPTEGGELGLNPVLKEMSRPTLFLVISKQNSPLDIVNQSGSLRSSAPPALSCHQDRFTQQVGSNLGVVPVACSDDDLVVFRGLGLPCTPAAGLGKLEGDQFRRLVEERSAPQLVLVAWNVSQLELASPAPVGCVVNHLLRGEDAYRLETSRRLRVWAPSEQEFTNLCAAADFKDRALACQCVVESLGSSTYSVREFAEEIAAANPPSYPDARRDLLKTLAEMPARGYERLEIAAKLQVFNRAHSNDVVDAHLQAAQLATDPKEKSLHVIGAEFMERLHDSSYLVRAAQEQRQGIEPSSPARLHPEEWNLRLGLIDRYVKICRELQRKS